jgi:hypothetical protein
VQVPGVVEVNPVVPMTETPVKVVVEPTNTLNDAEVDPLRTLELPR